jgi:hypothetical protein
MDESLRFKINAPHIVHEVFDDDEAAIINLKSGTYYSLDPVGAFVWARVDSGADVGEIVEHVLARYEADPAEVKTAIGEFIGVLQAEELIIAKTESTDGAKREYIRNDVDGTGIKGVFTKPTVERYSDMQELLLLDPIHEVDEAGWPNRKQEE